MNKNTFDKLQFNELKELVKSYCVSDLGKKILDKQQPSSQLNVVRQRLNETTEARRILDAESHVPLLGTSNIANMMDKLEKGMILEPSELVGFADFLRGCRKIKTFMRAKEFFAPVLCSYAHSMSEFTTIEESIHFSIRGNRVDSQASKELKRIRGHIMASEEKIEDRLNKFLRSSANKEYIQDFFISKKDDRYTVPIKASYKNHVAGAIVEVSSKGSTVFIEPATIAKLNVELTTLKADEAMEEYQILATLSGMIVEEMHNIKINIDLISQYDMIFAKGKYSKSIDGIEPTLNKHGHMKLVACTHPLLQGEAVPLDFEIGNHYRSLVITGPNAGGKTIVLKTIGLVALATMAGFHSKADTSTEVAIFDNIFADIGDNQSLENALSTFSSHIKNISEIMRDATNNTLLLFDEIGSGTEPNEGTALAIAILEEFYHMGCITVATTHYGEIKRYSENHRDFMNAAMQFNSETLIPMYKLLIGQSGESNALWISKKMNLRESVLQRAVDYMKNKEYNLNLIRENKKKKAEIISEEQEDTYEYEVGDKVKLLEHNDFGIVYKKKDNYNNLTVLYKREFIEVNCKRVSLELTAPELYPEGEDRKLQRDLERGSKKAYRQIQKDIRDRK
ncbi:endonuclease MutS2 [Brevibacillus laterosporus]|nr:endonuclease MutS2 [Brevibacillus laterosporus]TPG68042.1 endonuclease MutS2 [Brevibacillus laterosporus]